jgi:hypothetical protein
MDTNHMKGEPIPMTLTQGLKVGSDGWESLPVASVRLRKGIILIATLLLEDANVTWLSVRKKAEHYVLIGECVRGRYVSRGGEGGGEHPPRLRNMASKGFLEEGFHAVQWHALKNDLCCGVKQNERKFHRLPVASVVPKCGLLVLHKGSCTFEDGLPSTNSSFVFVL